MQRTLEQNVARGRWRGRNGTPEVGTGRSRPRLVPPTDIVLYTTFGSKEDLNAYAIHPLHLEVVEFVKKVVAERRVVDFVS